MVSDIKNEFVGRGPQKAIFQKVMMSTEPEFISVIGRRRVGKTALVKYFFKNNFDFEMTGFQNGSMKDQLTNFTDKLTFYMGAKTPIRIPNDWLEAFTILKNVLVESRKKKKKVIFFDELPWIATHRSKFLEALAYFWNDWASQQNIVVIVCGSAAAWMVRNVIRNKGGLHNRITRQMNLQPFNLHETELFIKSKNIPFTRYQIIQLYMMMGGIPHYLKELEKGESVIQNIDRICFSKDGLLREEFDNLYTSLYKMPNRHVAIIRALSTKLKGLTRKDVLKKSKISDGGGANRVLEELEASGFIASYYPFGKEIKGKLYRLTDSYSLFYLKFIEELKRGGQGTFLNLSKSAKWQSWTGYSFESVCMLHSKQIKSALGIAAVHTEISSFFHKGNESYSGFQIDMLIDRADQVINLVEIKFYDAPYTIVKSEANKLRQRRAAFRELTGTNKSVLLTFISPYGLKRNEYASELIPNEITINPLFKNL